MTALLSALLALTSSAAEPARRVAVSFEAPFLEPNRNDDAPTTTVESIAWASSGEGTASVRVWGLAGAARFKNRRLDGLETAPKPPHPSGQPWNGWRHRHGYVLEPGGSYVWNSLEDRPPAMSRESGEFYDAHLKGIWEDAVREALASALKGEGSAPASKPGAFSVPVSVPWADGRPAGKTLARYRLRLWGALLSVELPIGPGRGRSWLADAAGPARWSLDQDEWRRRHGYGADHPDRERLDALMNRCAAYWTEVTTHLFLRELDFKLRG